MAVSEKFNTVGPAQMEVEDDPLDAYMQDIEKNAAKQESVADLAKNQSNQTKTNEQEFEL